MDVDIWQKPTQYCNAIILQLKINSQIFMFTAYKREKTFKKAVQFKSFQICM